MSILPPTFSKLIQKVLLFSFMHKLKLPKLNNLNHTVVLKYYPKMVLILLNFNRNDSVFAHALWDKVSTDYVSLLAF